MGIIGWIILGLLAGLIAKAILPGEDPGGIIVTTLLGIVGRPRSAASSRSCWGSATRSTSSST